jgi:hypothetical protein
VSHLEFIAYHTPRRPYRIRPKKTGTSRRHSFSSGTATTFLTFSLWFLFPGPSAIAPSSFTPGTYRIESSFELAGDRMESRNQSLLRHDVMKSSLRSIFLHSLPHNYMFSILRLYINASVLPFPFLSHCFSYQ